MYHFEITTIFPHAIKKSLLDNTQPRLGRRGTLVFRRDSAYLCAEQKEIALWLVTKTI
jgi:hypothetical protein